MYPSRWFQRIFSRSLLFLTVVCCTGLVACGSVGSSASASGKRGTLTVTVLASPACPGPEAVDRPCPPRPVSKRQVQIEQADGSVVATATTDTTGHFSSTLAPRTYLLSVRSIGIGRAQTTSVTIVAGRTTTARIIIDSGIR